MPLVFSAIMPERVDRLPRADQVDPRLAALFVHQPKLHHGRHVERSHEAFEIHLEFLGRVSAQLNPPVQIARRLLISIVLRLLLRSGRRIGHVLMAR